MNRSTNEYDLYLDESGDFMETSTNPRERSSSKSRKDKTPSQLGALLVRRGNIAPVVQQILQAAKIKAQLPLKEPIHATKIQPGYQYQTMTSVIINEVNRQPFWQPVRLVNQEKVSYGDRVSTYTNLVAELVFRIFEENGRRSPGCQTAIRVYAATWMYLNFDDPNDQVKHTLRATEYERRIREYLGFASVRHGFARIQRDWLFQGLQIKSPKDVEVLQICDVLSNASANNFNRLNDRPRLADALKKRLGDYDFTLTTRELFERVDDLSKEYSFGMALMVLAEALVHAPHTTKSDQEFAAKLEERLNHIVERLGRMDFRGRDPQLALLVGWLDQLVGQQRLLDKGFEIAHWLQDYVEAPLRKRLTLQRDEATLDWFAYSLRRWALTACNHKGVLEKGRAEMASMRSLQPSVANQWERIPLVMDGLIAQAVHSTDCFEFDEASRQMSFVAESLKMQSNRFHEMMPHNFPEKLRFDLRARALGTLLQSEIFAAAADPVRLQSARKASEEAIAEFNSFSDRARQYQYRCHLETVARDFSTAKKYLVWSLKGNPAEPSEYSHKNIADLIGKLSIDPEWKAEFTLLHWLRIGAYLCLDAYQSAKERHMIAASDGERNVKVEHTTAQEDQIAEGDQITAAVQPGGGDEFIESAQSPLESERDEFLTELDRSEQLDSGACQGLLTEYPGHSILRFVAVINAARGDWDESLLALQRLRALDPAAKGQVGLGTILLAAQAEVAALTWANDSERADRSVDNTDSLRTKVTRFIRPIEVKNSPEVPVANSVSQKLQSMLTSHCDIGSSGHDISKKLVELARMIAY